MPLSTLLADARQFDLLFSVYRIVVGSEYQINEGNVLLVGWVSIQVIYFCFYFIFSKEMFFIFGDAKAKRRSIGF
jgi:hypothetical protein